MERGGTMDSLKALCDDCRETDYWKCRKCKVYEMMNRACELCGRLGAFPFIRTTKNGMRMIHVCSRCRDLLT